MRRNASREGLERFSKAQRGPHGPIATLGRLQQDVAGKWLWVWCAAYGCPHRAPMAIAPLIIRWGPDTSSDKLRQSARCSRCGNRGATIQHPSYVNSVVGFQPFPVERG